jgi:hypothetical protein
MTTTEDELACAKRILKVVFDGAMIEPDGLINTFDKYDDEFRPDDLRWLVGMRVMQ